MLEVSRADGILRLTLNRPERRNALGTELMRELQARLREGDADPATRVILLTGAPPVFCAGSDLKELATMNDAEMCAHEAATAAIARGIGLLGKPVLAAVEGAAIGGGFLLALSCDLVITAENARWHLPEVGHGWVPPWGLQTLLTRVGPARARAMTWGSQPLDGDQMLQLGLCDHVSEAGQALAVARAEAARLATLPAASVRSTKMLFAAACGSSAEPLDAMANYLFGQDLREPAAQATFQRIKAKS